MLEEKREESERIKKENERFDYVSEEDWLIRQSELMDMTYEESVMDALERGDGEKYGN